MLCSVKHIRIELAPQKVAAVSECIRNAVHRTTRRVYKRFEYFDGTHSLEFLMPLAGVATFAASITDQRLTSIDDNYDDGGKAE